MSQKRVVLPFEAKVRTMKFGPMPAGTLKPGDLVVSYNYEARKGTMITIADVRSVGRKPALSLSLLGVAHIVLAEDTAIVTRTEERKVADCPDHLIGTCILNPNQLLTRQISFALPVSRDPEAVELVWDGPEYLLAEGCLVGSYDLQ